MTAAVVSLACVSGVLSLVLSFTVKVQKSERDDWAHERRQLVDRAIARHTGEVIALDRAEKSTPKPPEPERLIEGLS